MSTVSNPPECAVGGHAGRHGSDPPAPTRAPVRASDAEVPVSSLVRPTVTVGGVEAELVAIREGADDTGRWVQVLEVAGPLDLAALVGRFPLAAVDTGWEIGAGRVIRVRPGQPTVAHVLLRRPLQVGPRHARSGQEPPDGPTLTDLTPTTDAPR